MTNEHVIKRKYIDKEEKKVIDVKYDSEFKIKRNILSFDVHVR